MTDPLPARPCDVGPSAAPGGAVDRLPGLLDAVYSAVDLSDSLPAVADWWRTASGATRVVAAIVDPVRRRVLAGASDGPSGSTSSAFDPCRTREPAAIREEIERRLGWGPSDHWLPLGDRGSVRGGVGLWGDTGGLAVLPPVVIDVTARLLFDVRDRAEREWRERLESLAEFAAGAGHEINNPLGTILGRVQLLLPGERDRERQRLLQTIGAQALRVRDMIGDVMLFARPPQPQPVEVPLASVLERVESRFASELAALHLEVDREVPRDLVVFADATQLAVVWSELLRNALRASPAGGRLTMRARRAEGAGSLVEFSLADQGDGLSEVDRRHLFDPFYSGRQAGRGLGFGLCKCWRIVTNHGGCLHVENQPGGGVLATVHWPIHVTAAVGGDSR